MELLSFMTNACFSTIPTFQRERSRTNY